jgi:hypothetical protein
MGCGAEKCDKDNMLMATKLQYYLAGALSKGQAVESGVI